MSTRVLQSHSTSVVYSHRRGFTLGNSLEVDIYQSGGGDNWIGYVDNVLVFETVRITVEDAEQIMRKIYEGIPGLDIMRSKVAGLIVRQTAKLCDAGDELKRLSRLHTNLDQRLGGP